jgi:Mce-associated membrane protein
MAADADAPGGQLSEMAQTPSSPSSPAEGNSELTTTEESCTAKHTRGESADSDVTIIDEADLPANGAFATRSASPVRLAAVLGLVGVVVLAALIGWFGLHAYQSRQAQVQRELFLQVARQGAVNLTTIDWKQADADVQRILDSATGTFRDGFSERKQPFIDVVKKAQSTSVGTITEAGLESKSGDEAQVLVGVSVKTSNIGAPEQEPHLWRMRISVTKVGNEAKVSDVEFVP